jgi:hypothetical protein
VEVQRGLAQRAGELARGWGLERVRTVEGDAAEVVRWLPLGSTFFFYCPFGGELQLPHALSWTAAVGRGSLPPC